MFSSGEKRGLIALMILLLLVLVFVVCRRSLFSSPPPVIESSLETILKTDTITPVSVNPVDSTYRSDKSSVRGPKKERNTLPRRIHYPRDPLSEPIDRPR